MTMRDNPILNHLPNDVLVKAMDDELSALEIAQVEAHLSECDECSRRYSDLRLVSDRVEAFASSLLPRAFVNVREELARELDRRTPKAVAPPPGRVLRRFGWGMAIAATLALAAVFAPGRIHTALKLPASASAPHAIETFEVNGETFVALPYSNPDLSVSSSHVVEMQIPVSSLTDAGIAFEMASRQPTALDHSVLANVLVGMDGQPLGVHVLTAE